MQLKALLSTIGISHHLLDGRSDLREWKIEDVWAVGGRMYVKEVGKLTLMAGAEDDGVAAVGSAQVDQVSATQSRCWKTGLGNRAHEVRLNVVVSLEKYGESHSLETHKSCISKRFEASFAFSPSFSLQRRLSSTRRYRL